MASSLLTLNLSEATLDVFKLLLDNMDLQQRFTCALVCSEWANAVAAVATPTIVRHGMRNFTRLQEWLDKIGSQVETLQLHGSGVIARLPCAQLQDLLLHGTNYDLILGSGVWGNIAAATKLTSVQLEAVSTTAQQADVVSALTALPDLQQLTWRDVVCGFQRKLSDSRLLQHLTRLTSLELQYVTAEALQHLSSLTKLQRLGMLPPAITGWAAADYPGLQQLQGLTSLVIKGRQEPDLWLDVAPTFPACVSYLTALQQLEVSWATFPQLNNLSALTTLTKLQVAELGSSSTPLRLPALQQLHLRGDFDGVFDSSLRSVFHTSSLASRTQLQRLLLCSFCLVGPGSLVGSMLQELELQYCSLSGHAAMSPWELLFPGPGRLPHLTSLVLHDVSPEPQQTGVEPLVACCRGLLWLQLDSVTDEQCRSLVQLTGLRDLDVSDPWPLSVAGLRLLAHLEQLTSLGFGHDFDWHKVSTVLLEQLSDKVPGYQCAVVNKAPSGCPPDVSARLLHACDMAASGQQQPWSSLHNLCKTCNSTTTQG